MRWKTALVAMVCLVSAIGCSASADHTQADIRFSQDMIVHHRRTIQLAELAEARAATPYVRDLSKKLIPAEEADIATMSGWLRSWHASLPPLQAATSGPEPPGFDRKWLAVLSAQLEHGIQMAQVVKVAGEHAPTRELADRIITEHHATLADIAKRLS